jgi:glutathione S-transferase
MLELWGRLSSCNVQKAMWAIGEVGQPCERIDAGGRFGGLDTPAFRALNPLGKVPVLCDGETVVRESNSIVRYVAARYGEGHLWHPDPARRAESDIWMDWAQASLHRDWIDFFWGFVRTPPDKRNPSWLKKRLHAMLAGYEVLDRRLADRDFLTGDHLTMADIPAGMTLYRYYEMEIDRPDLPHLAAWYARLGERPAYRESVMVPFDELVGRLEY